MFPKVLLYLTIRNYTLPNAPGEGAFGNNRQRIINPDSSKVARNSRGLDEVKTKQKGHRESRIAGRHRHFYSARSQAW